MSGFDVQLRAVTARYGRTVALNGVDLDIRGGVITGLLGRNGSGKTTAASVIAAFRRPAAGRVLVDGEEPWENERVVQQVLLVRESGDVLVDKTLRHNLALTEESRPDFSRETAERLLDRFELDPSSRPAKLSRGKKSAFGIVQAIAARAALTILDEVHLGLDAPSRYAFYDELIADYVAHPRTIVLSSHLIDEIERLIEDVVVLDHGRVLRERDAQSLREEGLSVTGPLGAVEAFVAGRTVLGRQQLGGTAQVTVLGVVADADAARARATGLELGPVPLQDLFVHLTNGAIAPAVATEEAS